MKKNYAGLLFFSLVMEYSLYAQFKITGALHPIPVSNVMLKGGNPSPLLLDTLTPPVLAMPCFTSNPSPYVFYRLLPPSMGYLTGNNLQQGIYSSSECAQRYSFTGNGSISEVLVWYGKKTGTTGTTSVKIYSVNPATKKPLTIMGTSNTITTGTITTTGYTSYAFSPPVSVTADFAASAVFPVTSGDTVAVISSRQICHSADSLSSININNAGWFLYSQLLNRVQPADTGIDVMILPVMDIAINVGSYPAANGLTLLGAYPNPAGDYTNIRYSMDEPSTVSLEVFDLAGRVIHQSSEESTTGTHAIKVPLKDISTGNYYYTIKTAGAAITGKFVAADK